MQSELAARPVIGTLLEQQRVQTRAARNQRGSFWQRLSSLYRLFIHARDASLDVEGVPVAQQSEEGRKHYLRTGGFGS